MWRRQLELWIHSSLTLKSIQTLQTKMTREGPADIKLFPSMGGGKCEFSRVGSGPRVATVAFRHGLFINTEQRGGTAKWKPENKRRSLSVLRWLLGFKSRSHTEKNPISGSDFGDVSGHVLFLQL